MDIAVVPLNCRLSARSLTEIVRLANIGLSNSPLTFTLKGRHRTPKYYPIDELWEYMQKEFRSPMIAVVSRALATPNSARESANGTQIIFGLACKDLQLGLVWGHPTDRGQRRDYGVAQTLIHELLHLAGEEHHVRSMMSWDGWYCPFMEYQDVNVTSLYPCGACDNTLLKFYERHRAG